MKRTSVVERAIIKVTEAGFENAEDSLAAEEPLEIRVSFGSSGQRIQKSISVTMRTPGSDFDLAKGFLFTEGIIEKAEDITSIKHCNGIHQNVVKVEMKENLQLDLTKLERNFYTTSSCGVCGKSSLEAVKTVCRLPVKKDVELSISPEVIYSLPTLLKHEQSVFKKTGGLHACALFDVEGNLILTREDVGRHNALDKLIGAALDENLLPLDRFVLLLSGRASFELIQKAWMAGIRVVAAVGAPSSLAVQMAEAFGMTLIGFLRGRSLNVYSGLARIKTPSFAGGLKGYQI